MISPAVNSPPKAGMRSFPTEITAAASPESGYSCNRRPLFKRGPLPVPLPSASWQDEHRSMKTARPVTSTGSGVPSGPASTCGEETDPHPTASTKQRETSTDRKAIPASLATIVATIIVHGLRSHTQAPAHPVRLLVCSRGPFGVCRADPVGGAGIAARTPIRLPADHDPPLRQRRIGSVPPQGATAPPTTGQQAGVFAAAFASRQLRREFHRPETTGS